MKCQYCNIALAPLRSLTDGEFCCDEHRAIFKELHGEGPISSAPPEGALVPLNLSLTGVDGETPAPHLKPPVPLELRPKTMAAPAFCAPVEAGGFTGWLRAADRLFALKFGTQLFNTPEQEIAPSTGEPQFAAAPVLPGVQIDPAEPTPAAEWFEGEEAESEGSSHIWSKHAWSNHLALEASRSWRWMVDVWRRAPSELRIMTVILPMLLALAVSPSTPNVKIQGGVPKSVQKIVTDRWTNLNKTIEGRAAVAYTDDFRSGLDGWESRSNLTTRWSYDATGFVQPGPLAVFRPTVDLTDYRFEFLAEIDRKGMGCAFRALDLDNYYAVKFVVVHPGPLPEVHVVRYAVIGGKEGPHVERPLPFTTRTDMLYRVRVDVQGADFAIRAQDQIVDFWSDTRLRRGGVGLFCGHGEKARVRWLEVSHQYDTLGKLCAYLAPYGIEGINVNIN
jgi:hypothetical protein